MWWTGHAGERACLAGLQAGASDAPGPWWAAVGWGFRSLCRGSCLVHAAGPAGHVGLLSTCICNLLVFLSCLSAFKCWHLSDGCSGTTAAEPSCLPSHAPALTIHACLAASPAAVPFEEDERDPSIWFLDHSYLENMFRMFKKVNGEHLAKRRAPNACPVSAPFFALLPWHAAVGLQPLLPAAYGLHCSRLWPTAGPGLEQEQLMAGAHARWPACRCTALRTLPPSCTTAHPYAARERIIGWYHTGPRLREADIDINELIGRYCDNPLLVICEVQVR